MCSCDFDPPNVYRETVRKARKDHTCFECGDPIRKGDLYKYASGIWDGRGDSFRWCDSCATIANLAASLHDGEPFCWVFGQLHATLEDCFPELFAESAAE